MSKLRLTRNHRHCSLQRVNWSSSCVITPTVCTNDRTLRDGRCHTQTSTEPGLGTPRDAVILVKYPLALPAGGWAELGDDTEAVGIKMACPSREVRTVAEPVIRSKFHVFANQIVIFSTNSNRNLVKSAGANESSQ